MAGLSWREEERRGGGMLPVWRKGPDRAEVDPFEFVRAIGGAERWDRALGRWEGTSIRSYLLLEKVREEHQREVLQRRGAEPWYFHCWTCFEGHRSVVAVVGACGSGTVGVGGRRGYSMGGGRLSGPVSLLVERGAFGAPGCRRPRRRSFVLRTWWLAIFGRMLDIEVLLRSFTVGEAFDVYSLASSANSSYPVLRENKNIVIFHLQIDELRLHEQ
jgi:hypothetical protein